LVRDDFSAGRVSHGDESDKEPIGLLWGCAQNEQTQIGEGGNDDSSMRTTQSASRERQAKTAAGGKTRLTKPSIFTQGRVVNNAVLKKQ
jgi:hypothetical protein